MKYTPRIEMNECMGCGKWVWHEHNYCTRCKQPMWSRKRRRAVRVMDTIIFIVSIAALLALALRLA